MLTLPFPSFLANNIYSAETKKKIKKEAFLPSAADAQLHKVAPEMTFPKREARQTERKTHIHTSLGPFFGYSRMKDRLI